MTLWVLKHLSVAAEDIESLVVLIIQLLLLQLKDPSVLSAPRPFQNLSHTGLDIDPESILLFFLTMKVSFSWSLPSDQEVPSLELDSKLISPWSN